ncbi:hypothetical protein ACIPYS_39500 [Kitasatospora sp. NPDC089913]|uniref:hypothetical protein n=1 Tax=Kitasatospora sp. NPDC089913 TaxID=3364080 RepID=UPI0038056D60
MDSHMLGMSRWRSVVGAVPPYRAVGVVQLALSLAARWRQVADELSCRGRGTA